MAVPVLEWFAIQYPTTISTHSRFDPFNHHTHFNRLKARLVHSDDIQIVTIQHCEMIQFVHSLLWNSTLLMCSHKSKKDS